MATTIVDILGAERATRLINAAQDVLENATPDGNGNVTVPGRAYKGLYDAFGRPPLPPHAAEEAVFGDMRPIVDADEAGQAQAVLARAESLAEELKAEGWTRDDFVREFGRMMGIEEDERGDDGPEAP